MCSSLSLLTTLYIYIYFFFFCMSDAQNSKEREGLKPVALDSQRVRAI